MKNLETLLETMKLDDTLTVEYKKTDVLGSTNNYVIYKYSSAKGIKNFAIRKEDSYSTESYNISGITRGGLNLYSFDILNNSIKARIKLNDLKLVSLTVLAPKEIAA